MPVRRLPLLQSPAERQAEPATMTTNPFTMAALGLGLSITLATCVGSVAAQQAPARPAAVQPNRTVVPTRPDSAVALRLDAQRIVQGDLVRGTLTPATATLTLNGQPVAVASDGRFIVGFDRDAQGDAVFRVTIGGRQAIENRVVIEGRSWNIQNINAPARGAARSDAEFDRRRPGELAQMAAARRTEVTSEGWRQNFIWPVTGRISGMFGSQRVYQGQPGSFHNGVDVAVPAGTPYVAPADGVVILAATEPFTLEGYLLMIDHGMGVSSVFLHSQRLDVRTGDVVRQGQRLGTVGATGRATGPHMHWAMRWRSQKVDAQRFAGPMPARPPARASSR